MTVEKRDFNIQAIEGKICGYASVYNVSYNCGDYDEIIAKGAFDDELKKTGLDVVAQIEHEGGLNVIGRTTNGTLQLSSDSKGLYYCCNQIPDTTTGRDILTLVRGGYITKSSIQFSVVEQNWDFTKKKPCRTISKVKLFDVAPVSIPASPSTSAQARSIDKTESAVDRLNKKIDTHRAQEKKYSV